MSQLISLLSAIVAPGDVGIPTLSADNVLVGVLNLVYFAAGAVAVIVIITGGIIFAASGGDANRVKLAKESVIYAVVGLAVVLSAFVITGFIVGSF